MTTVGVISADVALGLPDYRTGERAFQVLTQVAGRAGRGVLGGSVVLQTYQPEHYAIQSAADHDYTQFYIDEIRFHPAWTTAFPSAGETGDQRSQRTRRKKRRLS